MASEFTTPWSIYQKQLFSVGYGLPLWHPEPNEADRVRGEPVPISVGSVGYMRNGKLHVLFDSTASEDSPVNKHGVPADYEPFPIDDGHTYVPVDDQILQEIVLSRNVKKISVGGGANISSGVAPAGGGAQVKYQVSSDLGALVMLNPPGRHRYIESRIKIKEYLTKNLDSWLTLANSGRWALDVAEHDIMFVSGVVTTTEWMVMTLAGESSTRKEFSMLGNLSMAGGAEIKMDVSDSTTLYSHYRNGPGPGGSPRSGTVANFRRMVPAPHESNQAIFFHYWKAKKRRFFFQSRFEAQAGPHDPSLGPEDPDSIHPVSSEDFHSDFDPVNYLLDFILQHPQAEIAVGSDTDLALCFPNGIPEDIPAALQQLSPENIVRIDENGVATIYDPREPTLKRRHDAEKLDESGAFGSQDAGRLPKYPRIPSNVFGNINRDAASYGDWIDDSEYPGEMGGRIDGGSPSASTSAARGIGRRETASSHEGSVTALSYSPNGEFVATGSDDSSVIVWSAPDKMSICSLTEHHDPISAVAFSQDSLHLVTASQEGDMIVYDTRNWNEVTRLNTDTAPQSLAFSPDNSLLIAGANGGRLELWNTTDWKHFTSARRNTAAMTFIIFTPDGQKMATGGTEKDCVVWDTATLRDALPRARIVGDERIICAAAFAPDGRRIVTSFDDGGCTVWDTVTGDALVFVNEHLGPVWTVAFSPDGRHIASGSDDSKAKVVDSYTGAVAFEIRYHSGTINQVAFSPDGRFLATAATDKMVVLWKAQNGEKVLVFNEHDDDVTHMGFSPDGSTLASGSVDGGVYIRPIVTVRGTV